MLIYNYDPITHELIGSEPGHPSPLEPGKYLLPSFSTTEIPPNIPDGQVAVFVDPRWVLMVDNRGKKYWLPDGSAHVVNAIGEELPAGALLSRPVLIDDVLLERTHRLGLGFDYDFGDERGIHHVGTTAKDMAGWREVTDYANALLALGDHDTKITIATDTGVAQVTALEWQDILIAANAARQPIWQASFQLQSMQPIPSDYTDDHYWLETRTDLLISN